MDNKRSIKEIYDAGMAEVFRVVGSLEASSEQRQVAKQTAQDLSSMLVTHTLQSIEGRTALLAALIVELNQVLSTINTAPPYSEAIGNFNHILATAQELFSLAKKELI